MKVRAKSDGFYGGSRRRAGAEFDVPEGKTGKWFEPVDKPGKDAKQGKDAKEEPRTLSEMAKQTAPKGKEQA